MSEELVGHRGATYVDAGYIYCPYIPLTQTPVILDPDVFIPRRGILTRYGRRLLEEGEEYYGTVSVVGGRRYVPEKVNWRREGF